MNYTSVYVIWYCKFKFKAFKKIHRYILSINQMAHRIKSASSICCQLFYLNLQMNVFLNIHKPCKYYLFTERIIINNNWIIFYENSFLEFLNLSKNTSILKTYLDGKNFKFACFMLQVSISLFKQLVFR